MSVSYEKAQRDIAIKDGKILVTIDINGKHLKKGAFCISGAFKEENIGEVKVAFKKLLQLISEET